MECPFELPVKKIYSQILCCFGIQDKAKHTIVELGSSEDEADYIVQAINRHDNLVNACGKSKWLYDELSLSTLGAACKYGDNYQPPTKEDCLMIRELLEQALKEEAEKE